MMSNPLNLELELTKNRYLESLYVDLEGRYDWDREVENQHILEEAAYFAEKMGSPGLRPLVLMAYPGFDQPCWLWGEQLYHNQRAMYHDEVRMVGVEEASLEMLKHNAHEVCKSECVRLFRHVCEPQYTTFRISTEVITLTENRDPPILITPDAWLKQLPIYAEPVPGNPRFVL
jgi:hypothetical protein